MIKSARISFKRTLKVIRDNEKSLKKKSKSRSLIKREAQVFKINTYARMNINITFWF